MTTLLIIGAGPLQVPAYEEARRLGLRIVAIDRNPEAPGMPLADAAYPVDTTDAAGAVDVARREKVDGALTLCTDQPMVAVAAVNEALGLAGLRPDVALRATHKGHMCDAFARADAPIPRYRRVSDIHEARAAMNEVGLPLVVKPVARSGSQGVCRIVDASDLDEAFRHARRFSLDEAEILIEEYVEGPEVSVETISFGGKHHIVAITDKRTSGHPHHVEMGHVVPSQLPEEKQDAIRATTMRGLDALGIMDSTAHVELRVSDDGPRLIEIGARLGGDYIATELVPRSTGVNMVSAAIDLALGREPEVSPSRTRGAAICYLSAEAGVVERIEGLDRARGVDGVERVEVSVSPGEEVRQVAASQDRPGYVLAELADGASADAAATEAAALVKLITSTRELM